MFKVYSTNCPNCRVLLKKLALKDLQPARDFELVEDIEEITKVAQEYNIQSAPFIVKDGEVYGFGDAMRLINDISAGECSSCKLN